jgi:DNA-directed RNA polymerase specialized sigma24 family protein
MSTYTGHAWREGEWWVIDIDGVGATQARTLDKIDHMARSLVVDLTDLAYETVTVAIEIALPADVAEDLAALRTQAEDAAQQARQATQMQDRLVQKLAAEQGMSGREIAAILNVTPGRISQITKRAGIPTTRRPRTPEATTS